MPNYFFQAWRRWAWICVGPRCFTAGITFPALLVDQALVWHHGLDRNRVSNSTLSIFGEILTLG